MTKRLIALLCILLLFTMIAGCGKADESTGNENTENKTSYKDMNGFEFTVWQSTDAAQPFNYLTDTEMADEVLSRLGQVEANYNCKINLYNGGDEWGMIDPLNAMLAVGDGDCDFIYAYTHGLRPLGFAGGLYPVSDFSDVFDPEDESKWGSVYAQEMVMFDGVLCGLIPVSWLSRLPNAYYAIAANLDLFKRFNQNDPRELMEKNEWTRDKFTELIKTCTDTNPEERVYGLAAYIQHMTRMALFCNGTPYVYKNDSGTWKTGFESDAALEGLTWLKTLLAEYKDCLYKETYAADPWTECVDAFTKCEASMVLTSTARIMDTIAYSESIKDFAMLPFPAGPMTEYGNWPGAYEVTRAVAIPTFSKSPEDAAILINDIFEPLDRIPDEQAMREYYSRNIFHDPRDTDILFELSKIGRHTYFQEGGDDFINDVGTNLRSKSPKELVEKYISKTYDVINKYIIPNADAIEERIAGKE
jgi:ABC-type glycerol-3-phosphate transport system substrate-binding protein